MNKHISTLALAAAVALAAGQANALTYVLSGPNYGGTFTANADGTLSVAGSSTEYTGVQQQDKLYSAFSLAKGDSVVFAFSHIGADDVHSISIGGNFSTTAPTTVGYDISVISGTVHLVSTASDVVQSAGKSNLTETLTPGGVINFTKDSTSIPFPTYTGNTSLAFLTSPTLVNVSETVTPAIFGTNISFIQNSFIQSVAAPGPVPGTGVLGLGFLILAGVMTKAREIIGFGRRFAGMA